MNQTEGNRGQLDFSAYIWYWTKEIICTNTMTGLLRPSNENSFFSWHKLIGFGFKVSIQKAVFPYTKHTDLLLTQDCPRYLHTFIGQENYKSLVSVFLGKYNLVQIFGCRHCSLLCKLCDCPMRLPNMVKENVQINLLNIGKHPVFQIRNMVALRISHSKFRVETKLS